MTPSPYLPLPSLSGADALSGCWKLGSGRALTLRPTEAGLLRIAHGQVWLTFNNANQDDGVRGGDHFLGAGEEIKLLPGQVLVMESWHAASASPAYFSWDPLPASTGVVLARPSRHALAQRALSLPWRAGVAQPLRDLRGALGLAATASGRLAFGLAGVAGTTLLVLLPRLVVGLATGRARTALAARAFKAQASDSRAHCAIS
ncbi:MAG: DUF2917 domain-containing protein [Polaromonas sp.]|uniref:DUF2917 domain-containing protein n=1 Tax=Polaromonas sp. TaxID=1869339 RepID=UPI0040371217